MNLLLLLLVLGSSPHRPPSPAPSLLGTWKMKSVRLVTQRADGTPLFARDARVTFGETSETFQRNGHWIQWLYRSKRKTGTYRFDGRQLVVYDGEQHFQEEVLELTANKLVTVTKTDQGDGLRVETFITFVR